MRKKALTIKEREIQVINWFSIRIQHDNEDMATSYEIARGLGMSPSSHLRSILNGMADKEMLERENLSRSGRWQCWGYKLKQGTFQRPPKQARIISIKSAKGVTQMELI